MQNGSQGGGTAEYREAMVRAASLAWEERWEAAAAAYRRALSARPDDPAAERQLSLALSRFARPSERTMGPNANFAPDVRTATESAATSAGSLGSTGTNSDLMGRTASAHLGELSELPKETVRNVIESLRAVERDQASGRYRSAFEGAFALLQTVPTFLPLHILLAELYIETGQWRAGHDKLEAVEAAYEARGKADRRAAAA